MKKCIKCDIIKYFSDFDKCKKVKSGYRSECKSCRKEYSKSYYKLNLDKFKENSKNFRDNNKENIKISKLVYKINNKNKIKQRDKYYRENNSDKIKEYRKNNSDSLKIKRTLYKKIKFNDPLYKLKHNISCMIRLSLKNKGFTKKSRSYEILGCSFEEFKHHIESKFEPWMNWTNHGLYNGELNFGWDMDHIIPLCTAQTEQDIIKLNHYTNLQPLCSYTNRYIKRGVWRNNLSNKSS